MPAAGIAFFPLVAESLGGWHSCAEREVRKLGSALARHTGQLEGEAIGHLWAGVQNMCQRVSTAARHFFDQALLLDLRDFYTIYAFLHDFLRNFT